MIVGCLLVPALPLPGHAEDAERTCLAETVADVTEEGDGFLLMAGGLLVAVQIHGNKA